jgi:hypothetical protein
MQAQQQLTAAAMQVFRGLSPPLRAVTFRPGGGRCTLRDAVVPPLSVALQNSACCGGDALFG